MMTANCVSGRSKRTTTTSKMRAYNSVSIAPLLIVILIASNVLSQLDADEETGGVTTTEPTTLTNNTIAATDTTSSPSQSPETTTIAATTKSTTTTTTTTTTTKRPNPPDCPSPCWCSQKVVDCEGKQLTELPKFDQKSQYVEFKFANNSISSVDFKLLPMSTVESIDLSSNDIRVFIEPAKKKFELTNLRVLNLKNNDIVSVANLTSWKMPSLEGLNLARNKIVALARGDFTRQPKLIRLHLQWQLGTSKQAGVVRLLESIEDGTFAPLTRLQHLNLSQSLQSNYRLPELLFSKNADLNTLDLSYNGLMDVPIAVRSAANLTKLILSSNTMTSLRRSDFLNMKKIEHLEMSYCPRFMRVEPNTFGEMGKLKKLVLSNNPRFFDFSNEAFINVSQTTPADLGLLPPPTTNVLLLLDLSGNNMTTMSDPLDVSDLLHRSSIKQIDQLRLGNNPWDCSCALEWLVKSTNLSGQQPIHCKTPNKYADLEISQYFQLVDCQLDDSSLQRFIMVLFLLTLIVLTLLVFIQKTDICRRLQWRDQYGTIYYTKASFPTEQV